MVERSLFRAVVSRTQVVALLNLYRRSYPHFGRCYWTHNGPNNQTHADAGVRQDSSNADGNLVVKEL